MLTLDPAHEMTITDENAESLLYDLVATPSPSREEASATRLLVEWMAANGYDEAFIDEAGNAVGIIGNGKRDVMLLGHIDTFGGFPPVRVDGRTLYGRGSVDAKGALCTFAVAARQTRIDPSLRLIVVGAVEEEAASSKGARHIAAQYQPAACIIGEPSAWDRITLGYKGRLVLEYNWRVPLAHSASQVASPAELAVMEWARIQAHVGAINGDESRLFYTLDATLQELNTAQDGAFGTARMIVGFRLPPDVEPAQLAEDLRPTDSEACTMHVHMTESAYLGERDSALTRALRGAIRSVGGRPRLVQKTGTADMNVVAPHWDCPMVAYGPGDSALDHTPDEHIDLDEYLCAIRVLTAALENLRL